MTLAQYDDFAPDVNEIRERVIAHEFNTETGPDGLPYTGICRLEVPHWHDLISQALGRTINPKLSVFRLNLAGELPHSWVHSDEACLSDYASVLYLNPVSQGGTAFWRHVGLGLDHLPSPEELKGRGMHVDWFYAMMNREWKDLNFWEQVGFVGMKFNRFVTYPTSKFHSRYPFEGFGNTPADGRLVWACFYS